MGLCGSKSGTSDGGPADKTARRKQGQRTNGKGARNNDVDKSDRSDNQQFENEKQGDASDNANTAVESGSRSSKGKEFKVLLLGAGESGKSTIIQQLKILHQNGFTKQELIEHRSVVYDNVLEIAKSLVDARKRFEVPLESESGISIEDLELIENYHYTEEGRTDTFTLASKSRFPPEISSTLIKLWKLPSTKQLLNSKHRTEFYLMDSANYFIENIDRISQANYIPTAQDILRSRQKTSGIFDEVFDVGSNLKLHIYDVGGQRSERKKWIHCFDNVTMIIFCVPLSEYDQFLLEDQSQNRFQESLVLFENVVNSRWFSRTSVVLFLNKIDLFAEKLQKAPLEKYFPDYTGGQDINKAAKYILWRFVQLNRANLSIYPHVTQATDTSNIKLVFAAIKETILENSLKDTGVL